MASNNGRGNKSATKKTNNRKTGNKSTKSSAKNVSRNNSSKNTQNQFNEDLVVLVVFAFAIILLLANMDLAGSVGRGIKWLMFGIFGLAEYLIPFVFVGCALFIIVNKDIISVARIKTGAIVLLTFLFSALFQRIFNSPDIEESSLADVFKYCADGACGGGIVGGAIVKLLNPLGIAGSIIILLLLVIMCVVVITEKSFISGVRTVGNESTRLVKQAREDLDVYREHTRMRREANAMTDDEYRMLKEEEKAQRRIRNIERKEKQLAEKKAREEYLAKARMNNIKRGVTTDTIIPDNKPKNDDIDISEVVVDENREDEYSNDIYDPDMNQIISEDSNLDMDTEKIKKEVSIVSEEDEEFEQMFEETEAHNNLNEISKAYVTNDSNETVESNETDESNEVIKPEKVNPKPVKYKFPPISLLKKNPGKVSGSRDEKRHTAETLKSTLKTFGVDVEIGDVSCGPSVTRYELLPKQGVKVSKIVALSDDIKLNLAAADIRIEAPIPGKAAIGIEVPNKEAGSVYLRDLIESKEFKESTSLISFGAGKDIAGKTIIADIAKMPHMLIAGATGSGKSVCINTIIMSILYKASPEDVKLIMVDPKVVELSVYNGIPHLLLPVVTEPKKAAGALNWAVKEMDNRYKLLESMGVRNIFGYNEAVARKNAEGINPPLEKLPQIVIIIDELADLMMVVSGEVEDAICRIAQLARAAGIHMILATQRPSVNVVTGQIKANVPSKIAFQVASGTDSRVILDMNGAEKLLGKGDMLFSPSNLPKPVRVQGAFVSDGEIESVVSFLKQNSQDVVYDESITDTAAINKNSSDVTAQGNEERDSLFAEAGRFVIASEKGSIGSLQRHFKIGFNRAGRIMDQLADSKVVGPELGTKPRKVEMTLEQFEELLKG